MRVERRGRENNMLHPVKGSNNRANHARGGKAKVKGINLAQHRGGNNAEDSDEASNILVPNLLGFAVCLVARLWLPSYVFLYV